METLRKHNRRSASNMCSELIEAALRLPKYRQQLDEAVIQVPAPEDPRENIPQVQRRVVKVEKQERETPKMAGLLPAKEEVVINKKEEEDSISQLTPEKIAELQQLLKAMEMLKGQS